MLFTFTALALVSSVLLGGGTRTGFMGDGITQLICIPLLLLAMTDLSVRHRGGSVSSAKRAAWSVLGAVLAMTVIQLVPLPPGLLDIISPQPLLRQLSYPLSPQFEWRAVSITPHATWSGLVSLIVPVAIFAGVMNLGERSRTRLAGLIVALGAVSLTVGLLQVAQGPDSGLRFFQYTNPTEAVGFFANRNHFAALMYVTLVLAAAWLINHSPLTSRRQTLVTQSVVPLALALVLVVAIVAGVAMARSRAGMLLTMAALVGISVMARPEQRTSASLGNQRFLRGALVFAVLFALQFGLHRILTRFDADPLEDLRIPLSVTTFEAAWRSLPLGTGIGSFVPVFAVIERPSELLPTFANRAHNDLAEWLLETGIVGAILMLIASLWFGRSAWRVWRRGDGAGYHRVLQRGGTLVVVLLLAHSLVDYPLRTTALMAVFAFACGLLIPPPHQEESTESKGLGGSYGRQVEAQVPPPTKAPRPAAKREPWGAI